MGNVHELKKTGKMKVPGVVFASDALFGKIEQDKTLEQVRNVAALPGIVEKSIAMPDAHQGYGFCVGGVAAFDLKKGIISPGGIGYDINCGVRLIKTSLTKNDFMKKRGNVLSEMNRSVPSGVGHGGKIHLSEQEISEVLGKGAKWCLEKGYAVEVDLENTEDGGCISGADASKVSAKAKGRGRNQLGTVGAGNHFIEIQEVSEIFDKDVAKIFGLKNGQIVVMIHTGSRGLGHQVATDYIRKMEDEFGTSHLPDRELACAPLSSSLGQDYLAAMRAAANFAFANRQVITFGICESFKKFFPKAKVEVLYDVAHNVAKFEKFSNVDLCVHRKGATRSFGPGRRELPEKYRKVGQPVLIPGSMGTASYVLVGTKKASEVSFASTAHGAGRVMSRSQARREISADDVKNQLDSKGILIKTSSIAKVVDEAPGAYKDVDEVVRVSDELGIGKVVARLRPLGVVKG